LNRNIQEQQRLIHLLSKCFILEICLFFLHVFGVETLQKYLRFGMVFMHVFVFASFHLITYVITIINGQTRRNSITIITYAINYPMHILLIYLNFETYSYHEYLLYFRL